MALKHTGSREFNVVEKKRQRSLHNLRRLEVILRLLNKYF